MTFDFMDSSCDLWPILLQFMKPAADVVTFDLFAKQAVFTIFFFIIVTTIGLNIIFGIILDTFSDLRSNKVSFTK